jgi:hypothetical protein
VDKKKEQQQQAKQKNDKKIVRIEDTLKNLNKDLSAVKFKSTAFM